jgi:polyisoprenoid-binding protein YceI
MATYSIDPAHSYLGFTIRHLMLTKIRGAFKGLTGAVTLAATGEVPSAISATVAVKTLDTGNERRDGHVLGDGFLNAEAFPEITFKSNSITGSGPEFSVTGELTMRGVTKTIVLTGHVAGRTKDPWGNDRIGWSATTHIDRKEFGINYDAAVESGAAVLSDRIDIDLEIQAIPEKTA